MNKKKNIQKYIKTAVKTFFILMFCAYIFLGFDSFMHYDVRETQEKEIPHHLVLYTIEEIQKNPKHWNNADDCYEIGRLYEMIYMFDMASKYYLRSIEKAPRTYFAPHFKLAKLHVERSKFDDAKFIINLIPQTNNKKIKYNLGQFFEFLSVKYANKNQTDNAIESIKQAIVFYKSTNKEKYINAKNEYAYLLVKKSEELIKENKIPEAVELLKYALKENNSAELKYRLGILYYGIDNKKSLEYFENTQKTNPAIINYDLYYKLLSTLINQASQENEKLKEEIYKQKRNQLKKYINRNFISENEFKLENISVSAKDKLWKTKKQITIIFDIYNNSPETIKDLYAQIIIKTPYKNTEKTTKIKTPRGIISPYTKVKDNKEIITISNLNNKKNTLQGKIYLYKNSDFNKIEIGEFEI